MSSYMPDGAYSLWCYQEDAEEEIEKWEKLKNKKISDVRKSAYGAFFLHLSKFDLAKPTAKIWAKSFLESEEKDESEKIAEILDIGCLECYAILDLYDLFFEELAVSDPEWYTEWKYGGPEYSGMTDD